jgi:NDP-sugar pyrophosphorylase family protein
MVQLVIPMNGLGKRFAIERYQDPKPLIEVWAGKRIISYVLDCFPGVTDVVFLCNPVHLQLSAMERILHELCPTGQIVPVEYTGKGPVDTLLKGADAISDTEEVIVSYCDYGMDWDFSGFLKSMRQQGATGGIACYRGFHPHHLGPDCYGYVKTTDDDMLLDIREKRPFTTDKMSEWASSGAYYFSSGKVLKDAMMMTVGIEPTIKGEHYVSMVFPHLPGKTFVYEIERMLQFGTPQDLRDYQMWADIFSRPTQSCPSAPGITVLPMAGRGSRFSMVGYTTPKPFLPIEDQPMVCAALGCLPKTEDYRLVALRENPDPAPYVPGAEVVYLDEVTDGQATSVMTALEDVPDDVALTVSACDNGALYSAGKLSVLLDDPTVDVIVWAFRGDTHPTSRHNPNAYAWLDVDEETRRLQAVSVKKLFTDRPNRYCIIGTMFFRRTGDYKRAYAQAKARGIKTNGEYYVDNLLVPLLDEGARIVVFPVDHYLCWGTPNDYETFTYWEGHFKHADSSAPCEYVDCPEGGPLPPRD